MIRLDRVSREWPEFAIKDITLEVSEGQYLVIVGPTGAGKTLLLELLLGIHQPDAGQIFLAGNNITTMPPEKRGIGMVYQDYLLFPHLNVEQNLTFGLRYRRVTPEQRRTKVSETAKLLGIDHLLHRYPYTLSGGEKQRVAIGRALVTEPPVLLLDEPLSALDRRTARRLRGELKSLHKATKLTTIHVTHDLSEAREVADQIALIRAGKIDAVGTAEQLLRRPPTLFAATFMGALNLFEATFDRRNAELHVRAGPIVTAATGADEGTPYILIHPDEVALWPGHTATGPNQIAGRVAGLSDEGHFVTVLVRAEGLAEPLAVYVTRQAGRNQDLAIGAAVVADVRNAIHVLRD